MASIINATTTNGLAVTPDNSGELRLQTNNGTTAVTIDTSQRVLIGTTSGTRKLTVYENAAQVDLSVVSSTTGVAVIQMGDTAADNQGQIIYRNSSDQMEFGVNGAERMRITSGGYFKASNSGTYISSTGSYHEFYQTANNADVLTLYHGGASGNQYGLYIKTANDQNDTSRYFLYCQGGSTQRASFYSNGGLYNYSANNSNLSDRREKTDFEPAKSYLDVICSIPVQTFKYIDQNDDDKTLGVIAQDVQAVAPELVTESNWGTEDEPKMRLSIYQTDLQYALMKCIQELKTELDTVKAELQALKGTE